ncbi:ORF20 [Retroperitoneal fibromatosis-associated herpesvirus]|uniref:ORF20 n=1 Tax=Retroperitoneal fibromatosis-associated herpesvirus TaxID=111469 RepID=U5NM42_9GAMA|nr:ORF20 [Retroperitoneal fibromatosis-associated herpesvirus]AGY30703.1 ORF20 [Retroperitoneal fibromatosis-associated herpesvirus]
MTTATECQAKKLLRGLPAARKQAGARAHLATYRRILKYSTLPQILHFLSLETESPPPGPHKIFFEVTLGQRIADCIITVPGSQRPVCYIIELKTCMSNSIMFNDTVRASQRTQGLCQLADSVRYLSQAVPPGDETWSVVPVLIFKNQKTLKTMQLETPPTGSLAVRTAANKLTAFLHRREDARVRKMLSALSQTTPVVRGRSILDTPPRKRAVRIQTGSRRSKANRTKPPQPKHVAAGKKDQIQTACHRTGQPRTRPSDQSANYRRRSSGCRGRNKPNATPDTSRDA